MRIVYWLIGLFGNEVMMWWGMGYGKLY